MEHREESKVWVDLWQDTMFQKRNVMCSDDTNFSVVHVICDNVIFLPNPNTEKQTLFQMNHWVVLNNIQVTKLNVSLRKHLQSADSMLQCPFISTIVFKDLDFKIRHIVTMKSTYTQVTLSLMDRG
jgi:hypothetical protein